MPAKRSHTRVGDPVVHVRVRRIMITPKLKQRHTLKVSVVKLLKLHTNNNKSISTAHDLVRRNYFRRIMTRILNRERARGGGG